MTIQKPQGNSAPPLFPPGHVGTLVTDHCEELSSVFSAAQRDYFQLGNGRFAGRIDFAASAGVFIEKESWSPGVWVDGAIPPGVAVFGIRTEHGEEPRYHGGPMRETDVGALRPGDEIDFRVRGSAGVFLTAVDIRRLEDQAWARWQEPLWRMCFNERLIVRGESSRRLLLARLAALLDEAPALNAHPHAAGLLCDAVIDALLSHVAAPERRSTLAERHRIARKAEAWLRERLDAFITIRDLCAAVGAAERTIELGFQEVFGLSPKRYLTVMRLNAARRELRRRRPEEASVTAIAVRWGFLHLGRFAAQYRRMFGESPSETLRQ